MTATAVRPRVAGGATRRAPDNTGAARDADSATRDPARDADGATRDPARDADGATRDPAREASASRVPAPRTWIGVFFDRRSNRVMTVIAHGPAASAGVRAGDVIVAVAGTPTASAAEVVARVRGLRVGERADVVVERAGATVSLPVTAAERPDDRDLQRAQLLDRQAPELRLTTLDGSPLALAGLRGRVVLLDVWATWCGPCVAALPRLVDWHARFASRGLSIVGVSEEEPELLRAFAAEHGLRYPIALDPDRATWRDFLVQALPTTIVIDRAGVVRFVETGLGDPAEIEQLLVELLR